MSAEQPCLGYLDVIRTSHQIPSAFRSIRFTTESNWLSDLNWDYQDLTSMKLELEIE